MCSGRRLFGCVTGVLVAAALFTLASCRTAPPVITAADPASAGPMNERDRLRAERIISAAGTGELLPRQSLTELAQTLAGAAGVLGVDSGLAHLAAAVGTPAVTLYGPTRTELTGALGPRQRNLAVEFACAPCMRRICDYDGPSAVRPTCFAALHPATVFDALSRQMDGPPG